MKKDEQLMRTNLTHPANYLGSSLHYFDLLYSQLFNENKLVEYHWF